MTSVRELSNAAWTVLQGQTGIGAFNKPDYDTPSNGQWWIYYPDGGARTNARHGGIQSNLGWGFRLVCVGRTVEQCLNVVDKADTLLIGRYLDNHESTGPLIQVVNGAQVQPEAGDPVGARFSLTRQYQLTTRS